MKNGERLSLEQIGGFLAASEEFRFEANNREEVYGWVTRTLVEQEYGGQKREAKGLLRRYVGKMTGLRLVLPAAHFDRVRRRVVLHLHAGIKVILSRGHDRCLSDALPAAECGQRLIRQRRSVRLQFLMDSHEILLAGAEKLQDPLPVGFGFLGPRYLRDRG